MALDYTQLFTKIGKIVKDMRTFRDDSKNMDTRRAAVEAPFISVSNVRPVTGLIGSYDGFKSNYASMVSELTNYITNSITDIDDVLDPMSLPNSDIRTALDAIFADMLRNSETIQESVVTVGAFAAEGTPVGDGTILTYQTMDGITSPSSGVESRRDYVGLTSEVAIQDTTTIVCVNDEGDGLTAGSEQFQIHGLVPGQQWGPREYGTGDGPTISTLASETDLTNSDFESTEDLNGVDVPSSWTIANGDETNVLSSATAFRGSASLELAGDGAATDFEVSQTISLTNRGGYLFTARLYLSSGSAGTVTIGVRGTGLDEKVQVDLSTLSAAWTLHNASFTVPFVAPDDAEFYIQATGTWAAATNLLVDDAFFTTPTWHNGVAYALVPGATNWRRDDMYRSSITVVKGEFQDVFRELYGIQMPSSSTPTISDALAQ